MVLPPPFCSIIAGRYEWFRPRVRQTVNAEDLFRFAMEQDLQRTDAHPDDLRPRQMFKLRAAHLVWHLSLRVSCCSVLPDGADFRDGVRCRRNIFNQMRVLRLYQRLCGNAPLVVSRLMPAWIANHVAHRVNMRLAVWYMLLTFSWPRLSVSARCFPAPGIGVTGTTVGIQQAVCFSAFYRISDAWSHRHHSLRSSRTLRCGESPRRCSRSGRRGIDISWSRNASRRSRVLIRINFDVHSAENRRIFATNHPGAIDNHVAGFVVQAENRVAVVNARDGWSPHLPDGMGVSRRRSQIFQRWCFNWNRRGIRAPACVHQQSARCPAIFHSDYVRKIPDACAFVG